MRTNSSGTSWSGGGINSGDAGTSLAISTFFIATPSSTLAQINAALASGQNLILTPGIYQYSGSINVTNPNTVVLGLGYANLVPQSGTAAITVADVSGVQIAGLLIDAGPVNSPVLLQVGVAGASRVSHASNPTSISDVFFRIGGATQGTATESMEIDSDNVILDNIWAWRADHGQVAVGWTVNIGINGLVVNGDNVTALGLAVEHYEADQVIWNGEGGETIFYQSEMPYDVPSQSAWMDGSLDGYASYNVSPTVTTHSAYGIGVYSYFDQGVDIIANSGISVPVAAGVTVTDALTVFLAGSGQITYTIASDSPTVDNAGTVVDSASILSDVSSYGGSSGSCTAAPTVPGTPSGTGTSSSQISLTWGASTAGSSCVVSYNLFRSTTSGFTPSSSNQIASSLTTASYADSGLTAATTYYYIVEAVDGFGTSAASAQGSGTTEGGSCSAVPSAPSGLTATASSSSEINLSWTGVTPPANCTISSYSVYRSTSSGFTPSSSNLIASGVTGTTYSNSGLTASTAYYYVVEAVDANGSSGPSGQATATTQSGATSCSAVPAAPGGLTATASSSSAIGLSWSADTPPVNCTISSYSLYGSTTSGFTPGSGNLIASGLTSTSYSDTGLSASTTYYFVVEAVDSFGTSAASTQQSATTQAPASGTEIVAIAAGGPAESNANGGDYSFVADEDFSGGGDNSPVTATINLTQPGANAAPMGVYQYGRAGVFTYTIPGLTAGSQYSVLLHFAETYFTAAGDREFNVAINGTTVLTNLDVYATVGKDAALLEAFTATANSSGQIVIAFSLGAANQPLLMGLEIRSSSSGSCSAVPSAPGGLTATASSSSAIGLSWSAVTPPANCTVSSYSVYGSTIGGFTPSSSNLIASGVTGATYSNTGLAASTTYYYKVEAVDADGSSAASTQASAETQAASCSAVPSAPTGLTATASSSSAIGLSWSAVTPPANCSVSSYSVYGSTTSGFTPSSSNLIASTTGTTYSNTGLAASTTYHYKVEAVDADGSSAASAQQSATTQAASGSSEVVAIACGGPAQSNSGGGDYSFVADEDFTGGGDNSPVTATINLAQPGANAAPMGVYQYGRAGISTYTIPGLTAGSTYTVLLHFAETYFSAAGDREFNVAINGTTVLTNLDVYASVGKDAALLETFNTTANSSGQIVIAFTTGAANQPLVMGIEVRTN